MPHQVPRDVNRYACGLQVSAISVPQIVHFAVIRNHGLIHKQISMCRLNIAHALRMLIRVMRFPRVSRNKYPSCSQRRGQSCGGMGTIRVSGFRLCSAYRVVSLQSALYMNRVVDLVNILIPQCGNFLRAQTTPEHRQDERPKVAPRRSVNQCLALLISNAVVCAVLRLRKLQRRRRVIPDQVIPPGTGKNAIKQVGQLDIIVF